MEFESRKKILALVYFPPFLSSPSLPSNIHFINEKEAKRTYNGKTELRAQSSKLVILYLFYTKYCLYSLICKLHFCNGGPRDTDDRG